MKFTDKEIEILNKIQGIFDALCYYFLEESYEFTKEESSLITCILDLQEQDETWSAESIIKIYRNPVYRSILFKKGMTKNDDIYLYLIYIEYFKANEVDNFELLMY